MNNIFRLVVIFIFAIISMGNSTYALSPNDAIARQKKAIQGIYLIDKSTSMGDADMIHQYGRYIIYGDTTTEYSWDDLRKTWVVEFSLPYKLIYRANADYMTGYNIVINHPDGYTLQICTGDVNEDGKMDLWMSDSIFYTKQ